MNMRTNSTAAYEKPFAVSKQKIRWDKLRNLTTPQLTRASSNLQQRRSPTQNDVARAEIALITPIHLHSLQHSILRAKTSTRGTAETANCPRVAPISLPVKLTYSPHLQISTAKQMNLINNANSQMEHSASFPKHIRSPFPDHDIPHPAVPKPHTLCHSRP